MRAQVVSKGLFACCEPNLKNADGSAVNVEISAVAWDRSTKRLLFGSDKGIPGEDRSPVFSMAVDDKFHPVSSSLSYHTASLVQSAEKYEDFSLTADGRHMVATTGFDRVAGDGAADKDHYNRLLVWPSGRPEEPHLVAERVNDGVPSSVALREDLGRVLGGASYFKIEGLASVPGPKGEGDDPFLLFGIREVGEDYENFRYAAKVVGAPYRVTDTDVLTLTGDFRPVYEFDPQKEDAVRFTLGLSSLEYDPLRNRMHLLTSFEVEDDGGEEHVGAYLWSLPLADFWAGKAPELVGDKAKGGVFKFQNKAEGIAVLPNGDLFVVYDPDRKLVLDDYPSERREKHEAPFTVVSLSD